MYLYMQKCEGESQHFGNTEMKREREKQSNQVRLFIDVSDCSIVYEVRTMNLLIRLD